MGKNLTNETVINDIIHGMITIPNHIQQIIDTQQFQRLRYISQIGLTSFVYPSATCTRFEHSIGTFYLANQLLHKLANQLVIEESELRISENDIKCIEIAALCHDLGHGPRSHFWENAFDQSLHIKTRKHEEISVEIFKDVVNSLKSDHDKTIKEEIGLDQDMIDLIGRIINGEYNREKDNHKKFLFEIVANKSSGLDIDKLDYLCRDSNYLGWSNNKVHDIKRIIHFFRIIQDEESGDWHLALRDREIFNVYELFNYRHLLHRYGCQHRVVKSVECMFRNALKSIIENEKFRDEFIEDVIGEKIKYREDIWFSKEFISNICDYHIFNIIKKRSKGIHIDLNERNLYKLFCQIQIKSLNENQENNGDDKNDEHNERSLKSHIFQLEEFLKKELKPSIISLTLPIFALRSERNGDPLTLINFYSKENPKKLFKFNKSSLPDLIKLNNEEMNLMIFTDRKLNQENNTKLESYVEQLCDSNTKNIEEEIIKKLRNNYQFTKLQY